MKSSSQPVVVTLQHDRLGGKKPSMILICTTRQHDGDNVRDPCPSVSPRLVAMFDVQAAALSRSGNNVSGKDRNSSVGGSTFADARERELVIAALQNAEDVSSLFFFFFLLFVFLVSSCVCFNRRDYCGQRVEVTCECSCVVFVCVPDPTCARGDCCCCVVYVVYSV